MSDNYSGGEESDDEVGEIDIEPVARVNKEIIVKPENRRTTNMMSVYEMTECISIRTEQIAQHNDCFVSCADLDDPQKMAERELMAHKCPLRIRRFVGERVLPDGSIANCYEDWSVTELAFAVDY